MMPPQRIESHHYNMAGCTIQQQRVIVSDQFEVEARLMPLGEY
jgi:hypothetical protein